MDDGVREYIEAIAPEHRPLFDRIHGLILDVHPEAAIRLSYKIPVYTVGARRLHVGVWKHGLSLYGWEAGREGEFAARHPELRTSRGTVQLRPEDAAAIGDDELRALVHAALDS